jgi:hypothetical protein
VVLGGMNFGSACARKVQGAKPRRVRREQRPADTDPRQLDWVEQEVRP